MKSAKKPAKLAPAAMKIAWDDIIRRAQNAGINVRFDNAGIAVLEMPPDALLEIPQTETATRDATG